MEKATFEQAIQVLDIKEPYSDQVIQPERLVEILKDDVVQVMQRPGSWEGSRMYDLLRCHGLIDFDG